MRNPIWDDRARLAKLLFWLVPRDKTAQGLRVLADLIEVPDPSLPKAQHRAGGTHARTTIPCRSRPRR